MATLTMKPDPVEHALRHAAGLPTKGGASDELTDILDHLTGAVVGATKEVRAGWREEPDVTSVTIDTKDDDNAT